MSFAPAAQKRRRIPLGRVSYQNKSSLPVVLLLLLVVALSLAVAPLAVSGETIHINVQVDDKDQKRQALLLRKRRQKNQQQNNHQQQDLKFLPSRRSSKTESTFRRDFLWRYDAGGRDLGRGRFFSGAQTTEGDAEPEKEGSMLLLSRPSSSLPLIRRKAKVAAAATGRGGTLQQPFDFVETRTLNGRPLRLKSSGPPLLCANASFFFYKDDVFRGRKAVTKDLVLFREVPFYDARPPYRGEHVGDYTEVFEAGYGCRSYFKFGYRPDLETYDAELTVPTCPHAYRQQQQNQQQRKPLFLDVDDWINPIRDATLTVASYEKKVGSNSSSSSSSSSNIREFPVAGFEQAIISRRRPEVYQSNLGLCLPPQISVAIPPSQVDATTTKVRRERRRVRTLVL